MKKITYPTLLIILILSCAILKPAKGQDQRYIPTLQNPMTVSFLESNIEKTKPRLVYNDEILADLKIKIKTNPLINKRYATLRHNAIGILDKPLLERIKIGKRLLSVSREMLYRMNMLGVVYLVENDPVILERINKEVLAVCSFTDWNPSHYLDVAEMAMAVAFALDWTLNDLPQETIKLAKNALVEKGIHPSWKEHGGTDHWWINTVNNWNQVCHGGMIAASIAVSDDEPELATQTIKRALDKIPLALAEYMPDGVYPEGPTYWAYGTSFSVVTAEMFKSAFATDFGIHEYPGFLESATFKTMCHSPSGWYYNFADCGDKRGKGGDDILAWFAAETGNGSFFEAERFITSPETTKLGRLGGASLAWMSQFKEKSSVEQAKEWFGRGSNPIAIITDNSTGRNFYLGAKGGRGELNHGNMDGGSFVFELDGIRWVVDPGVQPYHELEKTGFDLWSNCQTCDRWKLLTKNNFGHSTITVNNELHEVKGQTIMLDFQKGDIPKVSFNLSAALPDLVKSALREFTKKGDASLLIEDKITVNEKTEIITWQLMTTADVELNGQGAILYKNGKSLKINNLSHPEIAFKIIQLDPPPFELDKIIKNLKRIELRIPVSEVRSTNPDVTIEILFDGNID